MCFFKWQRRDCVLIGVTNDGKVVGQGVTDATKQEIANHNIGLPEKGK